MHLLHAAASLLETLKARALQSQAVLTLPVLAQQDLTTECATVNNPTAITPDEYFDEDFDLKDRDIGRPKELTIRTQK